MVRLVLTVGLETIVVLFETTVRPELTAVFGRTFNLSVSNVPFFSDTDGDLSARFSSTVLFGVGSSLS